MHHSAISHFHLDLRCGASAPDPVIDLQYSIFWSSSSLLSFVVCLSYHHHSIGLSDQSHLSAPSGCRLPWVWCRNRRLPCWASFFIGDWRRVIWMESGGALPSSPPSASNACTYQYYGESASYRTSSSSSCHSGCHRYPHHRHLHFFLSGDSGPCRSLASAIASVGAATSRLASCSSSLWGLWGGCRSWAFRRPG